MKTRRFLSSILVLALLSQLLPLGVFAAQAEGAAAEGPSYAWDTAPLEDPAGPELPELPPTVTVAPYGPEELPEVPEEAVPSPEPPQADSDPAQVPRRPAPVLDEAGLRYLELLKTADSIAALSGDDAAFLREYTAIPPALWAELETLELPLDTALDCGTLAGRLSCSAAQVLEHAPTPAQRRALSGQAALYLAYLRFDLVGSETDLALRELLLWGHSFEAVRAAYGVSQVLDLSMDEALAAVEHPAMAIETGSPVSVLDGVAAAYAAENDREDTEALAQELVLASESLGTNSTDPPDEEEVPPLSAQNVSAPYTYASGEHEKVSMNTGALIWESQDYVLPGVNGLDLTITRRYDSQDAAAHTPDADVYLTPVRRYCVKLVAPAWLRYPDGHEVRFPEVDDEITYIYYDINRAREKQKEFDGKVIVVEDYDGTGVDVVFYYSADLYSEIYAYTQVIKTRRSANNHYPACYGLGQGWSLAFSSIEIAEKCEGTDQILHLADGRTYLIDLSGKGTHLKDYKAEDLRLEKESGAYTVSGTSSEYTLSYKDGKREYFGADGKLLAIRDRYDNTISFVHAAENGFPKITITDTLGRVVVLSGQSTAAGHDMTVTVAGEPVLTYHMEDVAQTEGLCALASYTDPAGRSTHYSYTLQTISFTAERDEAGKETTQLLDLTTVTHPTGAQTIYTYEEADHNLGTYGLIEAYRLTGRKDLSGGKTTGEVSYTYSSSDYSGHPACPNLEVAPDTFTYSTTLTDAAGKRVTETFDKKHRLVSMSTTAGAVKLSESAYEYDECSFPVKVTEKTYSADNQTAPLTAVTLAEYDAKGNLTASWSPLAAGDKSQTEYKTAYTYDGTYSLPLTKTYKTDAGTTVLERNTLSRDKKSISKVDILENNTLRRRTEFIMDARGNVTAKRESLGFLYIETKYTYQDGAYLASESCSLVEDADGAYIPVGFGQSQGEVKTTYGYDALGRRIQVTDPMGGVTAYSYDALGNITQITNPDDTTVTYARNYAANTLTVTDENGAAVKYTYTPLGLAYQTVDVQTGKVLSQKEYDAASRLLKATDCVFGGVTAYTYDALGRVTEETVTAGGKTLARTRYAYDVTADGQYQKTTKTVVGETASTALIVPSAPSIVTTEYTDKAGNVAKRGKLLGGTEYFDTYTYDYVGNVLTEQTALAAQKGLSYSAKYVYNGLGQVTETYNALGQKTTNSYDFIGRLTKTTDYAGTPTTYTYDNLGRLLTQTITVETGKTAVTKYAYDRRGNIVKELKPIQKVGETAAWARTEYTYDSRSRLTGVKQYDGDSVASGTFYTYDGVGNLLTQSVAGAVTSYTYDRFGNTLTMTDPLGQTESYTYAGPGQLTKKTDRKGQETTYTYDGLGRVTQQQAGANNTAGTKTLSTAYAMTGAVLSERILALEEKQSKEPGKPVTTKLISVQAETHYRYDALGRAVKTAQREGEELSPWDWDKIDLELELTPAPTRTPKPDIPPPVKPTSEIMSLEPPAEPMAEAPTEDGAPAREPGADAGADDDGPPPERAIRPTISLFPVDPTPTPTPVPTPTPAFIARSCYITASTYDLSGSRTSLSLTYNNTTQSVSYTYDSLDRLTTVTSGGADQAVYTYDTNGNRASLTYPGGVKTTYTYNKANWVTGVSTARSGAVLWSGSYTYYASGNQASKTEDGVTTSYTYDPLGRLTKESQSGGQTLQYTYNAHSDRTSLTASGTESYTVSYTYDAAGRLTGETKTQEGVTTTTARAYDKNGNLLSEAVKQGSAAAVATTYSYDRLDRLTSMTAGGTKTTYIYNARGLRTGKLTGGVHTRFLLDGGDVVAEQQGTAITAIYLRGLGLISRKSGAATQYYLHNAHGDVVALTGTAGAVQKRYTYDAFGNEASPSSSDPNPFRYCGEFFDKETGTYYLRARYYDPTVGRFTQQDTHWNTANMIYGDNPQKINKRQDALGLTTYTTVPQLSAILQSGNLYVYCINNPIYYLDETGDIAYPGEIHNLVVKYIADKYTFHHEQTIKYLVGYGRADLISKEPDSDGKYEVWEVKPGSLRQIAKGLRIQLHSYTNLGTWAEHPEAKLKPGDWIPWDSFYQQTESGRYHIWYYYSGNGIIVYNYQEELDLKPAYDSVFSISPEGEIFFAGSSLAPALLLLLFSLAG